jgi:prenyltransferase beta subunit
MSALLLGAVLAVLAEPADAHAASPDRTAVQMITPSAERAAQRALAWLARRQHEDGSFGSSTYHGNTAVTALAGMAFLASGSTPGRGPYGRQLNLAVDYLLASTQPSGFIVAARSSSHGPMYGHGFAVLFLAECYGMSPRPELRETLSRAVKLIVNCQNREGGWRYQPQRADADISVTVCEVMALRAARNAGLFVPKETIDRSIAYIKRCQNTDGGFMYMLGGGESAFARSAAAVVALHSAGIYEGPEVRKGIDYLMQFLAKPAAGQPYFEYGHYYAVQAMWRTGGDHWNRWFPAIRDELVRMQRDDGSWPPSIDADYATAMSIIVLQIPNNVLPIFQR